MEKFSSTLQTFILPACLPCRYDTPADAIGHAPEGYGVMILADGYPSVKTPVDEPLYTLAREMANELP